MALLQEDKIELDDAYRSYDEALDASGGGTSTEQSKTRKKSKKDKEGEKERRVSFLQLVDIHSRCRLRFHCVMIV